MKHNTYQRSIHRIGGGYLNSAQIVIQGLVFQSPTYFHTVSIFVQNQLWNFNSVWNQPSSDIELSRYLILTKCRAPFRPCSFDSREWHTALFIWRRSFCLMLSFVVIFVKRHPTRRSKYQGRTYQQVTGFVLDYHLGCDHLRNADTFPI